MAEEIHHPHDLMVRAVLSDLAEAASFLQAHLSGEVSQALNWSTLTLLEGSFVDENLRGSEADLLYEIEHVSGEESVWVYILLEHQSTPDRWMRFRLLKYCCRIWDMSFRQQPDQHELAVSTMCGYSCCMSFRRRNRKRRSRFVTCCGDTRQK